MRPGPAGLFFFFGGAAHLDGAVEVPGEAVLDEQRREVEHGQQQRLQLLALGAVAGQQPGHVLHRAPRVRQDAVETIQEIHPVVQLALRGGRKKGGGTPKLARWLLGCPFPAGLASKSTRSLLRVC